tara:strand:- start:503 stop:961 length:459 start_codon:yes stop_codon:yes gene_type:complete
MTTKGKIVERAYKRIGIDSIDTTLESNGTISLEEMLYIWYNQFIDIGYTFAIPPIEPLPADESDLNVMAESAVIMNLAIDLASTHGIVIDPILLNRAKAAKDNLYQLTPPSIASNPFMPLGAGSAGRCTRINYQGEDDEVQTLTYGGQPLGG